MIIAIRPAPLPVIADLEAAIPEFERPHDLAAIARRVANRPSLGLVAYADGQTVGYKLGYEDVPGRFYSWIGGVLPTHRRAGVARALLRHQEAWCRANAYGEIEVRTFNRFRGMLAMLITSGYEVHAIDVSGQIALRKRLDRSDPASTPVQPS